MGNRVNGGEYFLKKRIFRLKSANLIRESELVQEITNQKQNENMIF